MRSFGCGNTRMCLLRKTLQQNNGVPTICQLLVGPPGGNHCISFLVKPPQGPQATPKRLQSKSDLFRSFVIIWQSLCLCFNSLLAVNKKAKICLKLVLTCESITRIPEQIVVFSKVLSCSRWIDLKLRMQWARTWSKRLVHIVASPCWCSFQMDWRNRFT